MSFASELDKGCGASSVGFTKAGRKVKSLIRKIICLFQRRQESKYGLHHLQDAKWICKIKISHYWEKSLFHHVKSSNVKNGSTQGKQDLIFCNTHIFTEESKFQWLGTNKYNSPQNCLCKEHLKQIFPSHLSN